MHRADENNTTRKREDEAVKGKPEKKKGGSAGPQTVKRKTKLVIFAAVIGVILLVVLIISRFSGREEAPIVSAPDLSEHPIYSKYDFGKAENIIDIGVQPLWVPACIITEVMRRDEALREALAEVGLEVRFHPFLKGADVNFFLQRGDLEVGIVGDMPAINAAAEYNVLVAGLIQQGFCSIVARKHMLIRELRGKRIGYGFGSNAHYALLETLLSAGLGESDVHLVSLDVNEMPDALNEGRIDAFSAWEPTPTIALTRFDDQVVIHRSLSLGFLYFSRSFAEWHSEAVRQLVASELRAVYWLTQRRENLTEASRWALEAGGELTGQPRVLSAEQYVVLAERDLLGLSSPPTIPGSALEKGGLLFKEFQFLQELGKVSETAKWDEVRSCFDSTIIDELISDGRKYKLFTYRYSDE